MEAEIAFWGLLVLTFLAGSVCGIVAMFWLRAHRSELRRIRNRLEALERAIRAREHTAVAPSTTTGDVEEPPAVKPAEPLRMPARAVAPPHELPIPTLHAASTPVEKAKAPPAPVRIEPEPTFEFTFGARWLIWIGAVIFLGGVALGLKYAYDNDLIGPAGRLAIGVAAGTCVLAGGEWFRRIAWAVPSQAFTGAGLAIYYICIYFAMHVYEMTGQTTAMTLAVAVTGLAVGLAVLRDTASIALLAVIGGFLSPIMFSHGGNHPHGLFLYVLALDAVALGAALFRRWRALDLFCFLGTALMYAAWYTEYGERPESYSPALLYITVFYAVFLVAPAVYSLSRRIPEGIEGATLILANAAFSAGYYYQILYPVEEGALGWVFVGQAAAAYGLSLAWEARTGSATPATRGLIAVALALLVLAVPLELDFYAVPLAWATEAVVFAYLGSRYADRMFQWSSMAALAASVGALVERLPLHQAPFTPVLNVPFGSWVGVIAASGLVAACLRVSTRKNDALPGAPPAALPGLLSAALACLLLTMEVSLFWNLSDRLHATAHLWSSLTVLWAMIPLLAALAAHRTRSAIIQYAGLAAYAIGALVFLAGMGDYQNYTDVGVFHTAFGARCATLLSFWAGAWLLRRVDAGTGGREVLDVVAHAGLALLTYVEVAGWGGADARISAEAAMGLISAVWALHACVLVWFGLVSREPYRRYTGFLLFGLAVLKTVIADTLQLEPAYRIVSWLGSGVLLVAAALLYQRYSAVVLRKDE